MALEKEPGIVYNKSGSFLIGMLGKANTKENMYP